MTAPENGAKSSSACVEHITANVALPCSFGLLDLNSIQCNSHFGRYKKEIKKERKNQRKKEKTIIFDVSNL